MNMLKLVCRSSQTHHRDCSCFTFIDGCDNLEHIFFFTRGTQPHLTWSTCLCISGDLIHSFSTQQLLWQYSCRVSCRTQWQQWHGYLASLSCRDNWSISTWIPTTSVSQPYTSSLKVLSVWQQFIWLLICLWSWDMYSLGNLLWQYLANQSSSCCVWKSG